MPTSRKNNQRVNKTFTPKKNKNNMELETKPIFRQPIWQTDEQFTIDGKTLEYLANFVAPYRELIQIVDSLMTSGELDGKIQTAFFYEDRTEVTEADSRLKGLKEKEEQRLNYWRSLVEAKQKSLQELAEKAQKATDELSDSSESESEVQSENESEGKTIPFTPVNKAEVIN